MAGSGYRDWVAGEKPTAAQFDTFLQQQTVMVFASAAARNSALSAVLAEGLFAFLLDSNTLTVYSGGAWSTVGPVHGALLSWTPVVVQGATPTLTNSYSRYSRIGRRVFFEAVVSTTSSGTAANDVTITLPVAMNWGTNTIIGNGQIQDVSASTQYDGQLIAVSATTAKVRASGNNNINAYYGTTSFTDALASGDFVKACGSYEASADA